MNSDSSSTQRVSRRSWADRLAELVRFVTVNKRLPLNGLPAESSLFTWVERQRTAAKRGDLNPAREAALDTYAPGWRDSPRRDLYNRQLLDTASFFHREARFPAEDSTDRVEELLGRWLWKQRRALRDGVIAPDRKEQLDAALPGWSLGANEHKWLSTAVEVAAFQDRHARIPNRKSADPYERALGAWLHNQRTRLSLDASGDRARIDALDHLVFGWRPKRLTVEAA